MHQNYENEIIRHQSIELSDFAKENLHIIKEVSHMNINKQDSINFSECNENEYFILYVLTGNIKVNFHNEEYIVCEKQMVLMKKDKCAQITTNGCEIYRCILTGNKIEHFIKFKFQIFDARFQKKCELFFYTLFTCLDKYEFLDEFSLSSAQLKLYSDIFVYEHEAIPIHKKKDEINKALQFIEMYYYEDISLIDIASSCGYSEYYFSRIFKEVVNMTPYEYLIRKRLTQAKLLLLSSDSNIEDIAYACGFKNGVSFYKTFKKHYLTTPTDFRKTFKSK